MIFRILAFLVRHPALMRGLSPWMGLYNPFHPDHRVAPYLRYHRLRREAPVYRHPRLGVWILSRYDDVVAVLRDPRFVTNRRRSLAFQRRDPFGTCPGRCRTASTARC